MYSSIFDGDKYTTTYFSFSLILQVFLTIGIIYRLLRCKKQARSALGKTCDIYYNLLSMIFAESALMNVMCSLFLLVTSLPFPLTLAGGSWHHFTNIAFQVFIAIAPAVQVFSFTLNFHRDYSPNDFSLGVLQLSDHLSRC